MTESELAAMEQEVNSRLIDPEQELKWNQEQLALTRANEAPLVAAWRFYKYKRTDAANAKMAELAANLKDLRDSIDYFEKRIKDLGGV